jgi:tRNA (guanosine-2'-O-)-methyltransferase
MSAVDNDLTAYLSEFVNTQRRELLQSILAQRTRYISVVLEDIYYAQNASAVVRTSECLGIQELHIIENQHNYSINPDVVRGATKWLELHRYNSNQDQNTSACLNHLQSRGYKIVATSLDNDAMPLEDLPVDNKFAICFGTEEVGLSQQVFDSADYKINVPMSGFTQSFNISVCAGICLYYLRNKLEQEKIDWCLGEKDRVMLYNDWLVKSTPNGKELMDRYNKVSQ